MFARFNAAVEKNQLPPELLQIATLTQEVCPIYWNFLFPSDRCIVGFNFIDNRD
jgi:hypothetical protein